MPAVPALPAPKWVVTLWYAAGAVAAWAFGYAQIRGGDLWWHIAAGDLMAKHGAFLHADPWSFTFQGKPWLNDAWLSDLIYHWWVAAFGLPSLAWWKWGVLILTYGLLMRVLHRVTGDLVSAFVGAVLAVAVGEAFLDIRPHLYSLLGFSVLLSLTLGRERPSWWLPVLFLIWVQLHAIFVFGLMALAVLLAPGLIRGSPPERKRSALIGATSVLACLINPNFITVFTRPVRYALSDSPFLTIGEWLPPFDPSGNHSVPYPYAIGVFLACCVVLLLRRPPARKQPVTLVALALGALTLAMSLRSRRFVPMFGIAQSIVLAVTLAPWVGATFVRLNAAARRLFVAAMPVLALVLGLWWLWPYPARSYAFGFLVVEESFPVDTVSYITRNRLSGRVFAYYNWGGYLHLRTQGAMQVYIDGRADMVFDDATYQRYVSVIRMSPGWSRIVEDSGAGYVLWPKVDQSGALILQGLLATGRWRIAYEDFVSMLLERTDRPQRQDLLPPPDTAWRELTLGAAAVAANRWPEAETHFGRALELMPSLSACQALVQVQGVQGRLDQARQTLRNCDRIFPSPGLHDALTSLLDEQSARGNQDRQR